LMVHRQSTFIAIGSGHLPGKEGVIDLLKKKGYQVKPIIANKTLAEKQPSKELDNNAFTDWVEVKVDGFDYSARMPENPKTESSKEDSDIGKMNIHMKMFESDMTDDQPLLNMIIIEYPELMNFETMEGEELNDFLKETSEAGIKEANGELTKSEAITLNNKPAWLVEGKVMGMINMRMITTAEKNNQILLQVLSLGELNDNAAGNYFINSFKF